MREKYWMSPLGGFDDFGDPYPQKVGSFMFDARTKQGPWANMTEKSWKKHGYQKLGPGYGQKYELQEDGRYKKVQG